MIIPTEVLVAATKVILGESENETLRNNPAEAVALAKRILSAAGVKNNLVTEDIGTDLSGNEIWLAQLKKRFRKLTQLHEGVKWSNVENSLLSDTNAMKKLQILDTKGHKMNVCGEEDGKLIFISTWTNSEKLSADQTWLAFDQNAAKEYWKKDGGKNATEIIETIGVELAEKKHHELLRNFMPINGIAWLKSIINVDKTSYAHPTRMASAGSGIGIFSIPATAEIRWAERYNISLRALLRVPKKITSP